MLDLSAVPWRLRAQSSASCYDELCPTRRSMLMSTRQSMLTSTRLIMTSTRLAAARAASMAFQLPASVLLLTISIALPVVTFGAAFSVSNVHAAETQIWARKGYFLSAAIDLPPASHFGSLGLTITLAAFIAVAIVRHHIIAERLSAPCEFGRSLAELQPCLRTLHTASLGAALTAALGGHGVAAYQHASSSFWHNSFAACFVLFALAHFALESKLERLAGLSSGFARAFRLSTVVVATAGCATFLGHVLIEEMHKTPIGIGKLVAACAEILTCLCFLVYLATYSRSFHETRITLSVQYMPTTTTPCAADGLVAAPPRDGFGQEALCEGSSILCAAKEPAVVVRSAGGSAQLRRCKSDGAM